jgi:hypothetical protein
MNIQSFYVQPGEILYAVLDIVIQIRAYCPDADAVGNNNMQINGNTILIQLNLNAVL